MIFGMLNGDGFDILWKPSWYFKAACHDGFGLFEGSSMIFYGCMSWWFWPFWGFQHDFLRLYVMMVFNFSMIPSWLFEATRNDGFSLSSDSIMTFMYIRQFSQPVMISSSNFSCLFHSFLSLSWFQSQTFHDYSTSFSTCHDFQASLFVSIPRFFPPDMITHLLNQVKL